MLKFNAGHGVVLLNLQGHHVDPNTGEEADPAVVALLDEIASYPNNTGLTEDVINAIDDIFDSNVCVSPYYFLESGLHADIAFEFVVRNALGQELHHRLQDAGALEFLHHVKVGVNYRGFVWRILAACCMSSVGHEDVQSLPPDFIHAFVDWFRTSDGLSWREDILGKSAIKRQCLRNLINGFASIFDDPSLEYKAKQHRTDGSGKGWLGLQNSTLPIEREIAERVVTILAETKIKPSQVHQVTLDMASWLRATQPAATSLSEVMQQKARAVTFTKFLSDRIGEVTSHLIGSAHIARKLSDEFLLQLEEEYPDTDFYHLVPIREVERLQNADPGPERHFESTSRPLPQKFHNLVKEILDEGEAGWPGRYFRKYRLKGKRGLCYCPSIPTLIRCGLEIPLRVVQWRRLDSGEGDSVRFNADTWSWEENNGDLAGFWAKTEGRSPVGFPTRGYAIKMSDDAGTITGLWINTNKTGSAYPLPWEHRAVHKWLWNLRMWQEANNPISAPLDPEEYLDNPRKVPESTKRGMPSIFPLFRLPSGKIPTASMMQHAWAGLMAELERRWNEQNPDQQMKIVERQFKTKQPYASCFKMHGMRVFGVSRLDQGGASLHIISKHVVGHSTIKQTEYYVHRRPSEINQIIHTANAKSDAANQLVDDFTKLSYEQLLEKTVTMHAPELEEAHATVAPAEVLNVGLGLCPWGGERCHDGGPLRRQDEGSHGPSKSKYDPVPGGRRNCIACRHFVTGPPWVELLEGLGDRLLFKRRQLEARELEIDSERSELQEQMDAGLIASTAYKDRAQSLQFRIQQVRDNMEVNDASLFKLEVLLDGSLRLEREGKGNQLVAASRESLLEYLKVSEFEQVAMITLRGYIWPVLGDEAAEARLNQYLDVVVFEAGARPISLLTEVTDADKRIARTRLTEFLLQGTSNRQLDDLTHNRVSHEDLELLEKVRGLVKSHFGEAVLFQPSPKPRPLSSAQAEVV